MKRAPATTTTSEASGQKYVRAREAARLLGIRLSTLYSWTSARKLSYVRVSSRLILFELEEIESYLSARRVPAVNGSRQGSRTQDKGIAGRESAINSKTHA